MSGDLREKVMSLILEQYYRDAKVKRGNGNDDDNEGDERVEFDEAEGKQLREEEDEANKVKNEMQTGLNRERNAQTKSLVFNFLEWHSR